MRYEKSITPVREIRIAIEPRNLGAPFQTLYAQTEASGYEVWLLEGKNNFTNDFQRAGERRFRKKGRWGEVFHDSVYPGSGGVNDRGQLNVVYVSFDGTDSREVKNIWMPPSGYWVPIEYCGPNGSGVFIPYTLVPFETVKSKTEAIRRMEHFGFTKEYVSYFSRPDSYEIPDSKGKLHRYVGRNFDPKSDSGRFNVSVNRPPSHLGDTKIGSRWTRNCPKIYLDNQAA
jgi:hypothetical protein